MSLIENGTRQPQTAAQTVGSSTRTYTRSYSADPGLAAQASGAFTFAAGLPGTITLTGAFTAGFTAQNSVLVEGTNLNNGLFYVTAVTANALTVTPPPASETAPATATVRSA